MEQFPCESPNPQNKAFILRAPVMEMQLVCCGGGRHCCFCTWCQCGSRVNYLADSVRVKQTDRRARHQLLELLLGKIKALETNECSAFTPLLYNLYPVNPSITPAPTVNYVPRSQRCTVGSAVHPNGTQENSAPSRRLRSLCSVRVFPLSLVVRHF